MSIFILSFYLRLCLDTLSFSYVHKNGCICCCLSFCWTYAFQVCMHSLLHYYSPKFNCVRSFSFAFWNRFPQHLLPFYKQIFKFPNEDSKISNATRYNRIFALAQQKIDNNKKVHFTQNKFEEGKKIRTHIHA